MPLCLKKTHQKTECSIKIDTVMTQKELFAAALMIEKPWFIQEIKLDQENGKLEIWIDFERGSEFYYEDTELGVKGHFKAYDTTQKTWRHLNFFQYQCYLHAWIPRVDTGIKGKIRQVHASWEGRVAGFTLMFEAFIIELIRLMPVHQVAKLINVYDNKLWKLMQTYVDICRDDENFAEVSVVGVDETSVRKGHDYVSLFVDLIQKRTIFVTEGKNSETVSKFAQDLAAHHGNPENITQVSCDMSPAFISGVERELTKANIVFDRFHVTKIINEALDRVRKTEVKTNPILTKSKYIFLKNNDNLTANQKHKLEQIKLCGLNLKTLKALQIKEAFQQIYQTDSTDSFVMLLKKWYFWATHSRIKPIIDAAKTIKRHWSGIINWIDYKINNGILEGFNSIFQAAKAKARGYKKTETIKNIIYILTAKLDFHKANKFYLPT
jgi:transposase